jgi:hypothetical protein
VPPPPWPFASVCPLSNIVTTANIPSPSSGPGQIVCPSLPPTKSITHTPKPHAGPAIQREHVPRPLPLRRPRRYAFHPFIHHLPLTPLGIPSLWAGLSASVLRQSTYSTARFGLYTILAQKAKEFNRTDALSTSWTIACAGAAGGLAGLVGNPTEVSLLFRLDECFSRL